jgi:hypothetical protein
VSAKFILDPKHPHCSQVAANAQAFIAGLDPGKSWAIEVKAHRKARSCEANAYHWGVVLPTLARELGNSTDDWHEYMCGEYFGWRQLELGGRQISRPVRTTTADSDGRRDVLDTRAFWLFVDFCMLRAGAAGVYVPAPNERA